MFMTFVRTLSFRISCISNISNHRVFLWHCYLIQDVYLCQNKIYWISIYYLYLLLQFFFHKIMLMPQNFYKEPVNTENIELHIKIYAVTKRKKKMDFVNTIFIIELFSSFFFIRKTIKIQYFTDMEWNRSISIDYSYYKINSTCLVIFASVILHMSTPQMLVSTYFIGMRLLNLFENIRVSFTIITAAKTSTFILSVYDTVCNYESIRIK